MITCSLALLPSSKQSRKPYKKQVALSMSIQSARNLEFAQRGSEPCLAMKDEKFLRAPVSSLGFMFHPTVVTTFTLVWTGVLSPQEEFETNRTWVPPDTFGVGL